METTAIYLQVIGKEVRDSVEFLTKLYSDKFECRFAVLYKYVADVAR